MSTQWRIYGKDTVACKLSKADIPGFFSKQVTIGPSETAIIVKNGVIEESITESQEKIAGVWDKFKGMFGAGNEIDIYIIDTSPFDFTVFLGETAKGSTAYNASGTASETNRNDLKTKEKFTVAGMKIVKSKEEVYSALEGYSSARIDTSNVVIQAVTIDNELVSAECRIKASIMPDDAKLFSGLLKGRMALATWDLSALIQDELLAKVLIPKVSQYRSDELRGNKGLYDQITNDAKAELSGTFNLWGLTLEDFIINWGLTEAELQEIQTKRNKREDEAKEFAHKRGLADMQRKLEVEKTKISNLQQLKVAETQGDEELKDMLLASEISRDLMVDGKRVDVERINADVRIIQLDVDRQESNLRLETQKNEELLRLDVQEREFKQEHNARLAKIEAEDKELASDVRLQIQMATAKHERELEARRQGIDADFRKRQHESEDRYQQRKIKLEENLTRMGMMERLISQGIAAGATESSVLKDMLEQATEQAYSTADKEILKSRADAKAAKNNLEMFKEAEDRERQHQKDMTKLSSDMMDASKQTPGSTIVTGGGGIAGGQPPSNVNIVNTQGQTPISSGDASSGLKCPKCQKNVQQDWKVCAHCGTSLGKSACQKCGGDIKSDWKACPKCGEKL